MKKSLLLIVVLSFLKTSFAEPFHLLAKFGNFGVVLDDQGLACLVEAMMDSDNATGLMGACSPIDGAVDMLLNRNFNSSILTKMTQNKSCLKAITSFYVDSQLRLQCTNLVKTHRLSFLRDNYAFLF